MYALFEWGFRLALVLPWAAVIMGALALLVGKAQRIASADQVMRPSTGPVAVRA